MSHAEIWDDSALVDSWNEAVEEYKHYHSLHARGEKLEDVLEAHGKDLIDINATNESARKVGTPDEGPEDGMIMDDYEEPSTGNGDKAASAQQGLEFADKVSHGREEISDAKPSGGPSAAPPPLPHHLIGAVQDESLKNLLMSWYYAGYYTGLYEGQQMARPAEGGNGDKSG